MRIAILGDSWGVPNYYDPPVGVYWPAECHIEFLLKNHGHTVNNFSHNGGTNIQTLKKLQSAIDNKKYQNTAKKSEDWSEISFETSYDCDLVIWFFTEPVREISGDTPLNFAPYYYKDLDEKYANEAFSLAEKIKEKMSAKWLIIGGQRYVPDNITKFKIADFIIKDWRSSILGIEVPKLPFITPFDEHLRFITSVRCMDAYEDKTKFISDINLVIKHMSNADRIDFPDGAHPGPRPHKKLFDYINQIMS